MWEELEIYQRRNNFQAEIRRISIEEIINKNRMRISKKFKNLNNVSSFSDDYLPFCENEVSDVQQNKALEISQLIESFESCYNSFSSDFEEKLYELREKVSESYDLPIIECLNSNLINTLFKILEPSKLKFSKIASEALWILINISAFSQGEHDIKQKDVKTMILNCLSNTDNPSLEIKKNTIWLANNLMSEDKSFTIELLQSGVLYELTSSLKEEQIFDSSYLLLCKEMLGIIVSYFQDGTDFNKTLTSELVAFIYLFLSAAVECDESLSLQF